MHIIRQNKWCRTIGIDINWYSHCGMALVINLWYWSVIFNLFKKQSCDPF